MVRRKEPATFSGLRPWGKFFMFLAMAVLMAACSPDPKSEDDLRGEIQDLKKEINSMQEKLDKLQESQHDLLAGQQTMLALLQKSLQLAQTAPPVQPPPPPLPQAAPPFQPPPPLTVSQLLSNKDQYLGSRVTVKGKAGPVIMHRKSLLLVAPEGMVEVLLGSLPDEKTVVRLTSTPLEKPVTVTGIVALPAQATSAKLQITAEAVDF
jgi:hypothetical protein